MRQPALKIDAWNVFSNALSACSENFPDVALAFSLAKRSQFDHSPEPSQSLEEAIEVLNEDGLETLEQLLAAWAAFKVPPASIGSFHAQVFRQQRRDEVMPLVVARRMSLRIGVNFETGQRPPLRVRRANI
jgi:hypothetical protein